MGGTTSMSSESARDRSRRKMSSATYVPTESSTVESMQKANSATSMSNESSKNESRRKMSSGSSVPTKSSIVESMQKANGATCMSNESSVRIQWMWMSNTDAFAKSEPIEWKNYSDVENIIIEEAFQAGQSHVILDGYSIDFKHKIQILNEDGEKQRPVKRIECNVDENYLREERFLFTPLSPKRPFAGLYGWISPFIREVARYLKITKDRLPSKDKATIPMIVDMAADGIIQEGKKIGKQHEAEKLAEKLREKKNAEMKVVWECCAYLYSLESFLYKKMNETMRLIGDEEHEQDWRDKIPTLGPFCLLLWDNPSNCERTQRGTTLYRGARLSNELISTFMEDSSKKEESKPVRSFPSFTSCTRNPAIAEKFGNVLFIMKLVHTFSADIEPFSKYPKEAEELLSPGVCFTVNRVQFDKRKEKHMIYLDMVQHYRQNDRQQIRDRPRRDHPLDRALNNDDDRYGYDLDW